jgi:hypothetical protein
MIDLLHAQAYHMKLGLWLKKSKYHPYPGRQICSKILDPKFALYHNDNHSSTRQIFMTNLFAMKAHGMHGSICGLHSDVHVHAKQNATPYPIIACGKPQGQNILLLLILLCYMDTPLLLIHLLNNMAIIECRKYHPTWYQSCCEGRR